MKPPTLVICSKSRWSPAIRREHALARLAAGHGHRVAFIEQARDVRALTGSGAGGWWATLAGSAREQRIEEGIEVIPRATLIPAHRGRVAWALELGLLRRSIGRAANSGATVVATTPWQWWAVADRRGVRRVFDCADDWSEVIPRRRDLIASQYRRIGAQADAVIVNAGPLARLFALREVEVVRNGTSPELLATPLSPPPTKPVLVYAGTLSERFDVSLVTGVLERLHGWSLHLYGECRYARLGERPSAELRDLLASFPGRVSWHGPIERTELASRLDEGRVLVLPHRRIGAITGDAMKLYDYAARGRPIVSTTYSDWLMEDRPPGLRLADTAEGFADAVRSSDQEPNDAPRERRKWAETRSWNSRWPAWSSAAFGR